MGEASETKWEKSQTFNELPNEVWMKVLHYLNLEDIGRVAQLSSRFRILTEEPRLWTNLTLNMQMFSKHPSAMERVLGRSSRLASVTLTGGQLFSKSKIVAMKKGSYWPHTQDSATATSLLLAKASLTSLKISPLLWFFDSAIGTLAGLTNLTTLELNGRQVDAPGLRGLSQLSGLTHLTLTYASFDHQHPVDNLLLGLPNLTHLDLSWAVHLTDKSVGILAAACPLLTHLDLSYCAQVTARSLHRLPKLSHLNLEGCTLLSQARLLSVAAGCPLVRANLSYCKHLTTVTVTRLLISACRLQELVVTGCPDITREALEEWRVTRGTCKAAILY